MELSVQRNPVSKLSIAEELAAPYGGPDNNVTGGQVYKFWGGFLVSLDNVTPPCAVYGRISSLWDSLGGTKSGWGRPLADEQDTQDGGRCSVFEGTQMHHRCDFSHTHML